MPVFVPGIASFIAIYCHYDTVSHLNTESQLFF